MNYSMSNIGEEALTFLDQYSLLCLIDLETLVCNEEFYLMFGPSNDCPEKLDQVYQACLGGNHDTIERKAVDYLIAAMRSCEKQGNWEQFDKYANEIVRVLDPSVSDDADRLPGHLNAVIRHYIMSVYRRNHFYCHGYYNYPSEKSADLVITWIWDSHPGLRQQVEDKLRVVAYLAPATFCWIHLRVRQTHHGLAETLNAL